MGDVIHATFKPKTADGGKSRVRRRKERLADSLVMDHADCGDAGLPCDSSFHPIETDPA